MENGFNMSGFEGNAGNWNEQDELQATESQQSPQLSCNGFPCGTYETEIIPEARDRPPAQMQSLSQQNIATRPQHGYSNGYGYQANGNNLFSPSAQAQQRPRNAAQAARAEITKPMKSRAKARPTDANDGQQIVVFQQGSSVLPAPEKTKRTGFLDVLPMHSYSMPPGPRPLQFTIADILVILPNWFRQSVMIHRFLNNGLTSNIHIGIMRDYRHDVRDLSNDQVRKATTGLTDLYRKTMRKHVNERWTQNTHSNPRDWNAASVDVSRFVPDEHRIITFTSPSPIAFSKLRDGLRKLPEGADAGDLTRALAWATSRGQIKEFMFPNDIHKILGHIGYTDMTNDHTDAVIIARHHPSLKRQYDEAKASSPALAVKRQKRTETTDSEPHTPQPRIAQMVVSQNSESSQHYLPQQYLSQRIDPYLYRMPQQQQLRRALGSPFSTPSARQQAPRSSPAQLPSTQFYDGVQNAFQQQNPGRLIDPQFFGGMQGQPPQPQASHTITHYAYQNMLRMIQQQQQSPAHGMTTHDTQHFSPGQDQQRFAAQVANILPKVLRTPPSRANSPLIDAAMSPPSGRTTPTLPKSVPLTNADRFSKNDFKNGLQTTLTPSTDGGEECGFLQGEGEAASPPRQSAMLASLIPGEDPYTPSTPRDKGASQPSHSPVDRQNTGLHSSESEDANGREDSDEPPFPRIQPCVPEQNVGWHSSSPIAREVEVSCAEVRPTALTPPEEETTSVEQPPAGRIDPVTGVFEIAFEDAHNMVPLSPGVDATIREAWNQVWEDKAKGSMTALEALGQTSNLDGSLNTSPGPQEGEHRWAYVNHLPWENNTQYPDDKLLQDCVEANDPENFGALARAARWCRRNEWAPYRVGHVEHVLEIAEEFGYLVRP